MSETSGDKIRRMLQVSKVIVVEPDTRRFVREMLEIVLASSGISTGMLASSVPD
jgi:hypothetical protein